MSATIQHVNLWVYGVVQGVCFRAATRDQARELDISGFARNEPDGSVYIEAEGPATVLQEFCDWCRHGPPMARVERVEEEPGPVMKYKGFSIRFG